MKKTSIGNRILEAIKEKGYTISEFCADTKIPYQTLRNYRDGNSYPGGEALIKMSVKLNKSIDWILTGHEQGEDKKITSSNEDIMQGLTTDQQDEIKKFAQRLREFNKVKDELATIKQKVGL